MLEALHEFPEWNVIVADNGSRDRTRRVARAGGATVITEFRRGYGAACLAGIASLQDRPDDDIVVFLDADGSDDPAVLPALIDAVRRGADLALGSRTLARAEAGSLTLTQRVGNALACTLIRAFWRTRYSDLAPCRAVRLGALRALRMTDRDYGWTVQMQVRAARSGLRTEEIPSPYRCRRHGRSKVSGSLSGSVRAGITILRVIADELRDSLRATGPAIVTPD